jgi:hypothetical protein
MREVKVYDDSETSKEKVVLILLERLRRAPP